MDEANVFLSSIIRISDERLTTGIAEQRRNATWLRWVSVIGGLIIIVVVGGVTITSSGMPARSPKPAMRFRC